MKKIYCIGSSFTQGGGFEFDSKQAWDVGSEQTRGDRIKEIYSLITDEPKTQYNFSYSGQLQKILDNLVEVKNLGKSGYGNDYITRKIFEIVTQKQFNKDEECFVIEFTEIGRKEYFLNEINDYVILNYVFKTKDDENVYHFPKNDGKNYFVDTCGLAHSYYYDDTDFLKILDKKRDLFHNFVKNTISYKSEVEENFRLVNTLLSYLEMNKIKYVILSKPQLRPETQITGDDWYDDKVINFDGEEFHGYMFNRKLTIKDETKNEHNDGHYGLTAAKITAQKIKEKLEEVNFI